MGATCNPSIVVSVLKQEMPLWKERILALAESLPEATEDEIAWMIVEEMSANAAKLLKPIFDRRERAQRPPFHPDGSEELSQRRCHADAGHPLQQARPEHDRQDRGHAAPASWPSRKLPIAASASTRRSALRLPQAIAVAEAVERGLKRREAEGLDIATMGPVCTIMVGRLDDWLKVAAGQKETLRRSRLSGVGRRRGLQEGVQDCTTSADTGCGFSPRHSAITCTGASSSAAMW